MLTKIRKRQIEKYTEKSEICPICKYKKYKYQSFFEYYGIVEQHGFCARCGFSVEQSYSKPYVRFEPDTSKGFKDFSSKYHKKNIRMRTRIRRKYNIKRKNTDWYLRYA